MGKAPFAVPRLPSVARSKPLPQHSPAAARSRAPQDSQVWLHHGNRSEKDPVILLNMLSFLWFIGVGTPSHRWHVSILLRFQPKNDLKVVETTSFKRLLQVCIVQGAFLAQSSPAIFLFRDLASAPKTPREKRQKKKRFVLISFLFNLKICTSRVLLSMLFFVIRSVGLSVCRSVCRSVGRWVGGSVGRWVGGLEGW